MRKLMIASCALACCAAMTTDPALAATDGNNDGGDSGSLGVCSISDGMAHGGSSGKTGGGQVVISDGAASGHISDLPSKDDIGLGAIADSAWPIVVNSGH